MRSLAGEDAKKISVEWIMIAPLVWAFPVRISDERVDWAVEVVGSTLPIQPIVPSLITDQLLRELLGEVSHRAGEIFLLRFNQVPARIRCSNFIPAYAAEEDLVFARARVEIPRTVVVYQGNREGPVLGADNER